MQQNQLAIPAMVSMLQSILNAQTGAVYGNPSGGGGGGQSGMGALLKDLLAKIQQGQQPQMDMAGFKPYQPAPQQPQDTFANLVGAPAGTSTGSYLDQIYNDVYGPSPGAAPNYFGGADIGDWNQPGMVPNYEDYETYYSVE